MLLCVKFRLDTKTGNHTPHTHTHTFIHTHSSSSMVCTFYASHSIYLSTAGKAACPLEPVSRQATLPARMRCNKVYNNYAAASRYAHLCCGCHCLCSTCFCLAPHTHTHACTHAHSREHSSIGARILQTFYLVYW